MGNNDFKAFANSFQAIARLRLESIECLLDFLGNPQNDLRFIHVAGTNGKGSVCSFLQSIFTNAGYRTGKYTSPNLISVCERLSVDGELVSITEMEELLREVERGVRKVVKKLGEPPTQFEIWTAAAFLYFKAKRCDIVVLETGLGGTRDATNIIPCPLASVITRLDLDHTEYLGDTIEKIAAEKAGIIKKSQTGDGLCITANQAPGAMKVLEEACRNKENKLVAAALPKLKGFADFKERFDYTSATGGTTIADIECGLCGIYQPENAALAIETSLQLGIGEEHIRKGIKAALNPARFEVIRKDSPTVIYDGAHNKNGISALCDCLKRYFPDWRGAVFVMGFMGDKDISSAFAELKASGLTENSEVFAVQVKNNPRAATPVQICAAAAAQGIKATPYDCISDAYNDALSRYVPVIVCGSLYLYKDFCEVL